MSTANNLKKILKSMTDRNKDKIISAIHEDEKNANIIINGTKFKKIDFSIDILNNLTHKHNILKIGDEYIRVSYPINSDGVPFEEIIEENKIFCEEVFPIKRKIIVYLNHSELKLTGISTDKKSSNFIYSFLNNAESELKKVNEISFLKSGEKIKLNHETYVLKEYYLDPFSEAYKKNMIIYDEKNDVYIKINMNVYANGEQDDVFSEYYLPLEKTLSPEIVYPHEIEKNEYFTEEEIDLKFSTFKK